jgi:hypothetical protein
MGAIAGAIALRRRLAAFSLLVAVAATGAGAAERIVDLSQPGALARLKQENPAHYAAVRGILEDVGRQPEARALSWIGIHYRAKDVRYSEILLTTDPPKRDLSFRLDDVVYQARVTLPPVEAVADPAVSAEPKR